jgi:large subunit ribosomal protein L25
VAGERVKLQVQARESRGSADARRLRRDGIVPGVLYGQGKEPHAICVHERELRRVLTGAGGLHAILDVVVEGDGGKAMPSVLKDYQQDPLKGRLIHVDLQEVRLDQAIQAVVNVNLVGEAVGSREGGVLSQVNREVNVEALPLEIPESLDLDVDEMHIGDTLRVSDLRAPEGVTLLDDPETVLATLTPPTRVEEPEEVLEEGEEGEEGEVPEGEEAPEGAAEPGADAAGDSGSTEG